jgi:hypothetical protein
MRTRKPKTSPERKEGAGTSATPTVADLAVTVARPLKPLVRENTREKLLYKIACAGAPIGDEFFDEFPDRQELLELSLDIAARLLIVAIVNGELAPTQRIASIRVVASLAGKFVPEEEEDKFKPVPLAIPRGSKEEVNATLEKIRQLSTDTLSPAAL